MNTNYWWKEGWTLSSVRDTSSATCRWKCSQNPGRVGRLRRSLTWIYEVIGVGWGYSTPVCGSLIWQTSTGIRFPKSIFETFIQWEWNSRWWAHSQKMILEEGTKKGKSSVQLSLDWNVLEMNTDSQTKINKKKEKKKNKEVEEVFVTQTPKQSKNQCFLFWNNFNTCEEELSRSESKRETTGINVRLLNVRKTLN